MKKIIISSILLILLGGALFNGAARLLAADSPLLGAADSYSVLAGSIVTNTGPTTISGDLGISPSIGVPPHFTGFPPGVVGPPGEIHDADAHAAAAQAANTAAFGFLDQTCDTIFPGVQDLSLVSPLAPGTYCADAFTLTGTLDLSGTGVWIFKSTSTLITSANSSVTGGDGCSVWWRLGSSGTLGTGTSFIGNILALTDISLQTGAILNGRALVQTGQVTLDSNTIITPPCDVQPTATPTATLTITPTATLTITPTATLTITPTATAQATATAIPPQATATSLPQATATAIPPQATTVVPTITPTAPVISGLPDTGGAPIKENNNSPWLMLIVVLFSIVTLILGNHVYRHSSWSK